MWLPSPARLPPGGPQHAKAALQTPIDLSREEELRLNMDLKAPKMKSMEESRS